MYDGSRLLRSYVIEDLDHDLLVADIPETVGRGPAFTLPFFFVEKNWFSTCWEAGGVVCFFAWLYCTVYVPDVNLHALPRTGMYVLLYCRLFHQVF